MFHDMHHIIEGYLNRNYIANKCQNNYKHRNKKNATVFYLFE